MECKTILSGSIVHKTKTIFCPRWKKRHSVLYRNPALLCIYEKKDEVLIKEKPKAYFLLHKDVEVRRIEECTEYIFEEEQDMKEPYNPFSKKQLILHKIKKLKKKIKKLIKICLFGNDMPKEYQMIVFDAEKKIQIYFEHIEEREIWIESIKKAIQTCFVDNFSSIPQSDKHEQAPSQTLSYESKEEDPDTSLDKTTHPELTFNAILKQEKNIKTELDFLNTFCELLKNKDIVGCTRMMIIFSLFLKKEVIRTIDEMMVGKKPFKSVKRGFLSLHFVSNYMKRSRKEISEDKKRIINEIKTIEKINNINSETRSLFTNIIGYVSYKGFDVFGYLNITFNSSTKNVCDKNVLSMLHDVARHFGIEKTEMMPLGKDIEIYKVGDKSVIINTVDILLLKHKENVMQKTEDEETLKYQRFVYSIDTFGFFPRTSRELADELHAKGIRCKDLGKLYMLSSLPHTKELFLIEIIARATKEYFNETMRRLFIEGASESSIENERILTVISIFCFILEKGKKSKTFWNEEIKEKIKIKFDICLEYNDDIPRNQLFFILQEQCCVRFTAKKYEFEEKIFSSQIITEFICFVPKTKLSFSVKNTQTEINTETIKAQCLVLEVNEQENNFADKKTSINLVLELEKLARLYTIEKNVEQAENTIELAKKLSIDYRPHTIFTGLESTEIMIKKHISNSKQKKEERRFGYLIEEVTKTLLETEERVKATLGIHPIMIQVFEKTAQQYSLLGSKEDEKNSIERAVLISTRFLGKMSMKTLELIYYVSKAYNETEMFEKAEHVLTDTIKMLKTVISEETDTEHRQKLVDVLFQMKEERSHSQTGSQIAIDEMKAVAERYEHNYGFDDEKTQNALRMVFQNVFLFFGEKKKKNIRNMLISELEIPSNNNLENEGSFVVPSVSENIEVACRCLEKLFVYAKKKAQKTKEMEDVVFIIKAVLCMKMKNCAMKHKQEIRAAKKNEQNIDENSLREFVMDCVKKGPTRYFEEIFEEKQNRKKISFCLWCSSEETENLMFKDYSQISKIASEG